MKQFPILMLLLAFSSAIGAPEDNVLPRRADFSRYSAMVARSPFAVASAPGPTNTAPSWSKDLFIANAAHTQEVDLITVMSLSDKNFKEYLTTEKPNEHGYSISNIEWSDSPGATKATINKDSQFATIGFNEAILSQPVLPIGSVPVPNPPGGIRGLPAMPTPHVRGVIQRKPPQTTPNAAVADPPQS